MQPISNGSFAPARECEPVKSPTIGRRTLMAGVAAAISGLATAAQAKPSPMPKTEALLRFDASFWRTVDRINAGAWDALPPAELQTAMSSFTDLMSSMDYAAKATWSEPIHDADDVGARAVLAKHYAQPIGDRKQP